ncbi:unnamed protein product, partial [Lepidochelys olivacea]
MPGPWGAWEGRVLGESWGAGGASGSVQGPEHQRPQQGSVGGVGGAGGPAPGPAGGQGGGRVAEVGLVAAARPRTGGPAEQAGAREEQGTGWLRGAGNGARGLFPL